MIPGGTRLGPYEIVSPVGAGGMGEVYKGRDTRLQRPVAIKVLPASFSADAERLRRFQKEARAASSLNHPGIVTIYEIGRESGVTYLAMELVEGATLRELLAEGPLAVRRILSVATQVADGLAKAHASGIVHRDLKPENIMVSKDGFAKILDFGLAKLTAPEPEDGRETGAATVSAGTEPGIVMGTVGYMSPEQARGGAVDFRSDQFSFGSVLYEMATGRRAFRGESRPEVLAAIIRDDPEPVAGANPKIPAPLRWVIERCLAKDPAERYASTEDLARDLRGAEVHLSEISPATPASTAPGQVRVSSRASRALGIALTLAAGVALGALGWRLASGRSARPSQPPSFQRLTFQRGNVLHARFAPDGQTILYAFSREGLPAEVFSTRVGGTESRPLGLAKADVAAVSENGELLVLLKSSDLQTAGGVSTLARVPLSGGAPREIAQSVHMAEWLRGGQIVVQRHVSADHDVLELPLGTGRLDYSGSGPRVSRDGRWIAVPRSMKEGGEVAVLDESGKVAWAVKAEADTIAWHPNGELWLSRLAGQKPGVFAAGRGGSIRPILYASGWVLHDIAPDGRLILERAITRDSIRVKIGEAKERELSWLDGSELVGMSGDLKGLLFSETSEAGTRAGGAYSRATDGSPAVRLADGAAVAFSEDGRWAFVRGLETPARHALVPTGAGQPVPLDLGGERLLSAVFLPGSEPRLVITVGESPDRGHLELVTSAARRPLGIAPGFTPGDAAVSMDGTAIAYGTAYGAGSREVTLCSLVKPSCRKLPLAAEGTPIQWSDDGRYLYLRDHGEIPAHVTRYEIATGARTDWLTLAPDDPAFAIAIGRIVLSRDGRSYAFNPRGVQDSSLFVIEGLQ